MIFMDPRTRNRILKAIDQAIDPTIFYVACILEAFGYVVITAIWFILSMAFTANFITLEAQGLAFILAFPLPLCGLLAHYTVRIWGSSS